MASKSEDDYWYTSAGLSFEFVEETDVGKDGLFNDPEEESDSIFNSALEASDTLPIRSIISRKNLDIVLADVRLPAPPIASPVEDPIRRMFLGEFYNLHCYRTLEEKILLLDKAVQIGDGNVVLKVVLFLTKTLKPSIVYRYLTKRPIALQQYVNYLSNCNKTHDLELLYSATGNKSYLSNLFYLSSKRTSPNNVKKKLDQFIIEHLENLKDDYEKVIFCNHKIFIQYKLDKGLEGASPTELLALLYSRKVDGAGISDIEVKDFVALLKITDLQQEWLWLNILAANQLWIKILEYFTKSNWFTKKNVIKSNVSLELIVSCLAKHEAPKSVLEDFLSKIGDTDRSFYLGRKYKCHKFVIDSLVARKDRLALIEYRNQLPAQSEASYSIDGVLCSPDKKWMN